MSVVKSISFSALAMVLAGALGACSEDEAQNVVNEPTLQGRYVGPCEGNSALGLELGVREELEFKNASEFRRVQNFYESADCTGDSVGGALVIEGTYQVDSDALPDSQAGAMTLTYNSAMVNTSKEFLVTAFNTVNFCGQDGYALNQEVEITAGSDDLLCPVADVPATKYGAYTLEGNELYLNPEGPGGMSASADDRPTSLDTNKAYTRE